jgi:hypothetical protein
MCIKYSTFTISSENGLKKEKKGTDFFSAYKNGPKMYENIFKKIGSIIMITETDTESLSHQGY